MTALAARRQQAPASQIGPALALIGTGNVGSALLKLLAQRRLPFRLCAVANSRLMIQDPRGIAPANVASQLQQYGAATQLDGWVAGFLAEHPGGVVIDLTASESVAGRHLKWLRDGAQVITANKWAAAGDGGAQLQAWAGAGPVRYGHATTVGAGLPVLSTVRELRASGDRVERIQGIFSGTLSYLFQQYRQGVALSQSLPEAVRLGYTEPDPRLDLSGIDVARKLVIAGRAAGFQIDLAEVQIDSLVPPAWLEKDVAGCLDDCRVLDDHLHQVAGPPPGSQAVLCPIGEVDAHGARVGVRWLAPEHPCANARAGDNIIEIQSESYRELPLIIQGPGAGAQLTASRLLGELSSWQQPVGDCRLRGND